MASTLYPMARSAELEPLDQREESRWGRAKSGNLPKPSLCSPLWRRFKGKVIVHIRGSLAIRTRDVNTVIGKSVASPR